MQHELTATEVKLSSTLQKLHRYSEQVVACRTSMKSLRERWRRAVKAKDDAMEAIKRQKSPALLKLTRNGRYSAKAKAMVRLMILHGCKGRTMSKRTVARAVIEGGIAAKLQLAHEIQNSKSFTISADSTTHNHLNYEAKQVAVRVPSYTSSDSDDSPTSHTPQVRLVGVQQTTNHSSEASKASWLAELGEITKVYNSSPLAKRENKSMDLSELACKLKGMNGDHASAEKCTAGYMADWKKEEAIRKLGEQSLEDIAPAELIALLDEDEQARKDVMAANALVIEVGKAAFDKLSAEDQREITLFLWAGCCMHKEQNSFKGGECSDDVLKRLENPSRSSGTPLSDEELAALEKSTRGGAKAASIAGALFNNKDDKKGQGDTYRTFFGARYGKSVIFPDTNNTRFGSHGEAAIVLIKYHWTNLELNLANALEDVPTLTELCVLALYMLSVTFPYMRWIRGPGNNQINGLDLGPLHVKVRAHVQKIIDDPSILLRSDANFQYATLDGEPWEDSDGLKAIQELTPKLPNIQPLLVKFFTGSLGTWIRFTSEYAPGGLIDGASDEERYDAWMPATNDVNEGALGSLRRYMREKPLTAIHQYNALATYRANDTQEWMDTHLTTEEDYEYLAREARKIDESKLEKKRKAAQAEHDRLSAEAGRLKVEQQMQRAEAKKQRLANTILLTLAEEPKIHERSFTVAMIDEQLDLLRSFESKTDTTRIPPKKDLKNKPLKIDALVSALRRYYSQGPMVSEDGHEDVEDRMADVEDEEDEEDNDMDVDL
ncbi:hypothetical protein ONZ45_g11178 [Pleurotus djamor]|nr:hypothetical protein ONZ45_g11178 [Pleurotus djamor]